MNNQESELNTIIYTHSLLTRELIKYICSKEFSNLLIKNLEQK